MGQKWASVSPAIAFGSQSTPFPPYMFKATSLHPVIWWKGVNNIGLPEGCISTLIDLHTACAPSAPIERVFASFGLVHSKIRNRLGNDKTLKLVFVYRLLRGNGPELTY